jgi:phosphatidate cytidylyltransferase
VAAASGLPAGGKWGELKARVASGLVMAGMALAVTWAGGAAFAMFWGAAASVIAWEWARLTGLRRPAAFVGAVASAVALGIGALLAGQPGGAVMACLLALALGATFSQGPMPRAFAALGACYACAAVLPVLHLRLEPAIGAVLVMWLYAVVWGTDVAAYFAGRAIGGPRLWPRVSPKKTWSGAIGGASAAICLGTLVLLAGGALGAPVPGLLAMAVAALVVSAVSQLGDLFESALKRRADVKDSSALIPGHGGLMDRLDGFIPASLATLVLLVAALR